MQSPYPDQHSRNKNTTYACPGALLTRIGLDWTHKYPAIPKSVGAAESERQTIINEYGEDPDNDTVRHRFDANQERLAELSEGAATWPDDIKANAVVIASAARLAAICLDAVWAGIAAAVVVLAGGGPNAALHGVSQP